MTEKQLEGGILRVYEAYRPQSKQTKKRAIDVVVVDDS